MERTKIGGRLETGQKLWICHASGEGRSKRPTGQQVAVARSEATLSSCVTSRLLFYYDVGRARLIAEHVHAQRENPIMYVSMELSE